MFKRILALVLCLCICLPLTALAQGWIPPTDPDDVQDVTDDVVYDVADGVGDVVNVDAPGDPTDQQMIGYALTPLEVVLVLDRSGSMAAANPMNNKSILSYAQDAAIAFCQTLFAINPASRVAVVSYDDRAVTVQQLTGFNNENQLQSAIRSINYGGTTNIGGGIARANSILDQDARAGRQRVTVVLSDGIANASDNYSDPVDYTVLKGQEAANDGLIYTIGLVGGMSDWERQITRNTLGAGYETRYFEVDFDNVSDMDMQLASAFMTIAMSGSSVDEDVSFYRLWVDGTMDFYVSGPNGEHLSSAAYDRCDRASFGSYYTFGDNMDEKMVMIYGTSADIGLHGLRTAKGSYTLSQITGRDARERVLVDRTVQTHPAMYQILHAENGRCTTEDASYEPLDIYATDPFTGQRTRGLEVPAIGKITGDVSIRAYPSKSGPKLFSAKSGMTVSVLAKDDASGFSLVSFLNDKGRTIRGWVLTKYIRADGYVPNMIWLDQSAEMTKTVTASLTPSELSPEGSTLKAGQKVRIRHAERDTRGNEWVYLQPANKDELSYVPADAVKGWTEQTSHDFRLGYAVAQPAWRTTFGDGYTEVMWAVGDTDGSGTVLSGRTTSTKKPFSKNRGDRDAFVLSVDPLGVIESAVTAGGKAVDSYHCIIPAPDGWYVSGITRSNDGDFKGAWDEYSTTGSASGNPSRSNALIGRLNEDMSIRWIKSFGSGDTSYGFDMVVELSDGCIAGVGWMTDSRKSAVRGNGNQDFYVVILTPEGDLINERTFGSAVDDIPDSAVATPDGGLILVGCTWRNGSADGEIWVLDQSLNEVSHQIYGGRGEDIFDNIRALPDGTYLVTGFTDSASGDGTGIPRGGKDFWAMNIDGLGRPIWVKRYGGSKDEELCGTTILPDGTCLLVGYTSSNDGDILGASGRDQDAWAICIDDEGRMLWQYASGLTGNDAFNTAGIDPADDGYVLAGLCNSKNKKANGLIVKLLPFGLSD